VADLSELLLSICLIFPEGDRDGSGDESLLMRVTGFAEAEYDFNRCGRGSEGFGIEMRTILATSYESRFQLPIGYLSIIYIN